MITKEIKPVRLVFGGIAFVICMFAMYFIQSDLNKYESIGNKHFEGQVHSIKVNMGTSFIILNDGRKIQIPNSRNKALSPYDFCDFIKQGDRVEKKHNSDMIYIYRNSKCYKFKLSELNYYHEPN